MPVDPTRKERSRKDLAYALESVLYEMVILSTALLLRDKRYFFQSYSGLQWGPPQIANDVIRLKSRLLFDFFYPNRRKTNDIVVEDFKIKNPLKTLAKDALHRLLKFKDKVNKWTIHLTWTRTKEAEPTKSERQLMEQCALDLLTLSSNFINECLAEGFKLEGTAKLYHQNFMRLFSYLKETSRIEEGKGKRPATQICLETLSS
jgi:hypothetical protein